jgi:hypothetical protein
MLLLWIVVMWLVIVALAVSYDIIRGLFEDKILDTHRIFAKLYKKRTHRPPHWYEILEN